MTMRSTTLAPLLLLAAACGGSLWPTTTVVTPAPVSEAFRCADSVTRSLGYKPFQSKPEEGFLRTRKNVREATGDILDQQPYDQIRVELAADSGAPATRLSVTAESWTEQLSRRGRDQVEHKARPAVIADAATVVEACGTALQPRPDRVPNAN